MPSNILATLAVPALLLTASLQSGTALAATPEIASRRVSYSDLDLSRPKGAEALYARIRTAAHEVCQPPFYTGRLEMPRESQVCIGQAIEHAVSDVNSPLLTTYFMAKSGHPIVLAQRS